MGATLYEMGPGYDGDRVHMHYGAEEMFFVLSGRVVCRNLEGEEVSVGDFLFCPEGHAGLHAFSNRTRCPDPSTSAGGRPSVVAYPGERATAELLTRVPELPAGEDPGIIARFALSLKAPQRSRLT